MLSTLCASLAANARHVAEFGIQYPFGSEASLRAQAVEAGQSATKVQECIAARCHGGMQCTEGHPPLFECSQGVFFSAQDLMCIPAPRRGKAQIEFVKRYMPIMIIAYGKGDSDLAKIQSLFHPDPAQAETDHSATKRCATCGVTQEGMLTCARCKSVCYCSKQCQKVRKYIRMQQSAG